MKFKNRKIRTKEGGIEIRLSFSFTKDEVEALDRIPDDLNASFDTLRQAEGDDYQKMEWYFTWLRIIVHWTDIWERRHEFSDLILRSIQVRKLKLEKSVKKKRRRK